MKKPATSKIEKPSIRDTQIRGQIATMESDLARLEADHKKMCEGHMQRVVENQKRAAELTGGINALKKLVS